MPGLSATASDLDDLDFLHQAETEPIPGYRLIHPLGKGGFGEVWKCEAPGGLLKAIKFVDGGLHALDSKAPAQEELQAIQRVKTIRHPFILSMERVEIVENELVIVMELADRSLADVLLAQRQAGKPGIPREALLAYLREAAEVLDVMNARHGLQHLDIKPRNLFLVSNHVKVGDFGLVSTLSTATPGSPGLGAVTPLYASPEVFQGSLSSHSDQYSLAIVYQELLTGTLPFTGKNSRQLLIQHLQGEPDLAALPEADRPVVARALAKKPHHRFPSCSDFVHALVAGQTEVVTTTTVFLPDAEVRPEEDTRKTPSLRTMQTRTICVRPPTPPTEGAGRVKILDLVSRTPLTEVWRGQAADGSPRLVKVLFGCRGPGDEGVGRLQKIRHPALLPCEVLHHGPGRLVLATPPGDRNLRDVLVESQAEGHTGIPRSRLLGYLRTLADALDSLSQEYGVHHLALNPRTLVLDGQRLLMADFGLAQLVWRPASQSIASLNSRYSAPELQQNEIGPACDQYSLALLYHELLTGAFPNPGTPGRRGEPAAPSVDRLPECDRAIVARALHPDPRQRWESLGDLVAALEAAGGGVSPAPLHRPAPAVRPESGILQTAGEVMQTRFGTNLAADVIHQRLEGFRQQWSAQVQSITARDLIFQMPTPRSLWQRWTGRQPGLEIRLHIAPPEISAPAGVQVRTELRMDLRARDCSRAQSIELLKVVGPLLVESLRAHLQVHTRGRTEERLLWHHPLLLCSILPDGSLGAPIECQGKDISLNGIGFYLPGQLPSSNVVLYLPQTEQTPEGAKRARIVRVQGCGDGWYEVGAVLQPEDEPPEPAERPSEE